MPYIRFNPGWEFENISREFDKFRKNFSSPENRPRVEFGSFKPRVDVVEDSSNIYFEIELPGVKKEQFKVSVDEDNILTVKGEKVFDKKEDIKICCRNERAFGIFSRSFQLPEMADKDKIDANYKNGVLYLSIPKLQPVKSKEQEIEIK